MLPVGSPFQNVVLTAQLHIHPETSLESLVPLVTFLKAWKLALERVASSERIRHAAQVQNVNFETNRVTDQIRGLVCHDRSQGRILSHIHPSMSQEVPEVCFWGQSIPISGSSVRPSIITPHFHKMLRCSPGTSSASGYSH